MVCGCQVRHVHSLGPLRASPFARLPFDGRCTQRPAANGNTTLYIHLLQWPKTSTIQLLGMKNRVLAAKVMGSGATLETTADTKGAFVRPRWRRPAQTHPAGEPAEPRSHHQAHGQLEPLRRRETRGNHPEQDWQGHGQTRSADDQQGRFHKPAR